MTHRDHEYADVAMFVSTIIVSMFRLTEGLLRFIFAILEELA